MRPALWQPPAALSSAEQRIITRIKRAKLFVSVRLWRHVLFAPAFQGAASKQPLHLRVVPFLGCTVEANRLLLSGARRNWRRWTGTAPSCKGRFFGFSWRKGA